MPRPRKYRKMSTPPSMVGFKPFGIPFEKEGALTLLFEEWEAIRLLDHEGMNQEEAAVQLNVSRPTLTRIYERARNTIAKALVEGRAFVVEGGNVQFESAWKQCGDCYSRYRADEQEEQCPQCSSDNVSVMEETQMMPGDCSQVGFNCICPHCNHKKPHRRGVPCRQEQCPECGSNMMREHSYHHQQLLKNKEDKNEGSATNR